MAYLYTVLYITGFGAAGTRPCVSSFGADQLDERSRDYKVHLERFFNIFYLSVTIGAITTFTMVAYIQKKYVWGSAFGALATAMGISYFVFFIGTHMYRQRWLLIQYCLIGVAKVFCFVSFLEYLYQEAPHAMRSVGSTYVAVVGELGCFVVPI